MSSIPTVSPTAEKPAKRRTWKKPKDKPKRPLSAYNIYFQHMRLRIVQGHEDVAPTREEIRRSVDTILNKTKEKRRHRKTHGKISFSDLARTIADKWKTIAPWAKAVFDEYAELDMQRYRREVKIWKEKKEMEGDMLQAQIHRQQQMMMLANNHGLSLNGSNHGAATMMQAPFGAGSFHNPTSNMAAAASNTPVNVRRTMGSHFSNSMNMNSSFSSLDSSESDHLFDLPFDSNSSRNTRAWQARRTTPDTFNSSFSSLNGSNHSATSRASSVDYDTTLNDNGLDGSLHVQNLIMMQQQQQQQQQQHSSSNFNMSSEQLQSQQRHLQQQQFQLFLQQQQLQLQQQQLQSSGVLSNTNMASSNDALHNANAIMPNNCASNKSTTNSNMLNNNVNNMGVNFNNAMSNLNPMMMTNSNAQNDRNNAMSGTGVNDDGQMAYHSSFSSMNLSQHNNNNNNNNAMGASSASLLPYVSNHTAASSSNHGMQVLSHHNNNGNNNIIHMNSNHMNNNPNAGIGMMGASFASIGSGFEMGMLNAGSNNDMNNNNNSNTNHMDDPQSSLEQFMSSMELDHPPDQSNNNNLAL